MHISFSAKSWEVIIRGQLWDMHAQAHSGYASWGLSEVTLSLTKYPSLSQYLKISPHVPLDPKTLSLPIPQDPIFPYTPLSGPVPLGSRGWLGRPGFAFGLKTFKVFSFGIKFVCFQSFWTLFAWTPSWFASKLVSKSQRIDNAKLTSIRKSYIFKHYQMCRATKCFQVLVQDCTLCGCLSFEDLNSFAALMFWWIHAFESLSSSLWISELQFLHLWSLERLVFEKNEWLNSWNGPCVAGVFARTESRLNPKSWTLNPRFTSGDKLKLPRPSDLSHPKS